MLFYRRHIRYWRCSVSPASSRRAIYLSRAEFRNSVVLLLHLPRVDHSRTNLSLSPSTLKAICLLIFLVLLGRSSQQRPPQDSCWDVVIHAHSLRISRSPILEITNNYETFTILHKPQITTFYFKFLIFLDPHWM